MDVPHVSSRLPWFGSSFAFGANPDAFLGACQEKFGDVFSLTLNGRKSTFFLDAHDLAEVFRNAKTLSGENVLPEIGAKLFGFDPEAYKLVQHQLEVLTSKMMRGKALLPLTRRMQLELERAFLDIPTHAEHTGLTAFMFETLFPASTRALFGSGVHSTDTIRLFLNLDRPLPFILGNMPSFLFPSFRRAQAALRRLMAPPHENQSEVMDERHRLWDLTNAAERDHAAYDASVLWAAQANTIPAAVWTIYYLLRDPAALGAVTSEVQNVLQAVEEESPHGMPLIGDAHLAQMEALDSAIWEALRLTAGTIVMRDAVETTKLVLSGGQTITLEKGERLLLYTRSVHIDPDIYEAPTEFRYDRFVGQPEFTKGGRHVRFPLLPFGGGKSICPGRHFAINEFKLLVAMLVAGFDFELSVDEPSEVDLSRIGLGTMPPKSDIIVSYRFRGFGG